MSVYIIGSYLTSVWNDTSSLVSLLEISKNKPSQIRGIKPLSSWHIKKRENILDYVQKMFTIKQQLHFSPIMFS